MRYFELSQIDDLLLLLSERKTSNLELENQVREILKNVKENGDEYIENMTREFDCPGFSIDKVQVTEDEINDAIDKVEKEHIEIFKEAIENVRKFHEQQKQRSWIDNSNSDIILGQLVNPVEKVGLYVPGGKGGKTPLVSTLIMNAIPAQIAGVKELIVATPPSRENSVNPYILATAKLLGIENIFKIGSAWAIGALAYGTKRIPKVDMVVGPGNIFVTIAKKLLIGEIGIDMIAGPSEIVVIADDKAEPKWIAADLLSQAEHDEYACSILITTSDDLIEKVKREIEKQLNLLPRKDIAEKSLNRWGCIVKTNSLEDAFLVVNEIAPEHLELQIENPWNYVSLVKNAGCVFLGGYTPEPIGDYFAGPNHVLPTTATARFSSGLSVETFYKKTNLIWATRNYTLENAQKIATMARIEGLEAHARSAMIRLDKY